MKLICEKDKILKALNSVTKAVAVRTTMPILEGILIQTNDNEIKLTTYDLEIGIEYVINDCKVEEQGATVVNAIMFTEIIRRLPDTDIQITVNDKNLLVIECEGSLYKLATMNPDEFPELPKISVENSIDIEQTILKDMIRKTIFAVSTEENRPIFTGCLFEVESNKLSLVAVDGFRLALRSIYLNKQTNNFSAVIPGKTLNEVNKILLDSFEPVKIGISKNQALFEMDNCKVVTRILDGEFLNTFNGKTGTFEPISEETYNKILEQFVSLATREPIRIATNMACPVEINEESMEDHLRNTDEERIAIINYYIAVAKGEFSREYQQVFSKVDEKMQAKANFESQLENFRKIKKGRFT